MPDGAREAAARPVVTSAGFRLTRQRDSSESALSFFHQSIGAIHRVCNWLTRERMRIVAGAVIACTVLVLGYLAVTSSHGTDAMGRQLGTDFSRFYAAGRAVLEGKAAEA